MVHILIAAAGLVALSGGVPGDDAFENLYAYGSQFVWFSTLDFIG